MRRRVDSERKEGDGEVVESERGREMILCIFLQCLRFLAILINNVYAISAHFFLLGLLSPSLIFSPETFWSIEEVLFGWLLCQVSCWNYTAGYALLESGDPLPDVRRTPCLLMPNHQSTADVPFCMSFLSFRAGGKVMWIMDKIFKYTSFGWVATAHRDFFILAGKQHREKFLVYLRDHLKSIFIPKKRNCLVLFPEGGFLRKRKLMSQEFAKKNDLPMLEHCTLPRTGALEVILDVLGPKSYQNSHLKKIIDVTIAYPKGRPINLPAIILKNRPSCFTHVHYRVFDIEDLPRDPDKLKTWMYDLYIEKEMMLSKYYQTGIWPHDIFDKNASPPKELCYDPSFFILIHFFFLFWFFILMSVVRAALWMF